MRRHDERFRQALDIHRRCLAELETHKLEISQNFGLKPALTSNTRIKGIIVSKMAKPTVRVWDEDIPIVTSDELKSCITNSDLSSLYNSLMLAPKQLPTPQGRSDHRETRFGDYRVRFPIFILEEE